MRLIVLFFVSSVLIAAESPEGRLLVWMNTIAQRQLDARQAAIAKIRSVPDAEARKRVVRAKILQLLGGLPDYDGPLNAKITGRINEDRYVIEKVIFESLPRFYITANLYLPKQEGRLPGVLMPMGHWESGKPAGEQIAANLALKGFVVLVYDPIGQGERLQSYDRRLGGSLVGGSVEQHFLAGAQSLLMGESFARYRIWDAKRALDYLSSRKEVANDRIGCTGCSGGGTLTTYISALDPRIKVAAPSCYMNSFRVLYSGPVGDSEQSLPDFLSSGLDQTDYVELFSPKPWLISSTEQDFFTPAGAKVVYDEAKQWYGIYNAGEKVKWVVGPGGHGTPLPVREAIYDWMIRWLKEDGSAKTISAKDEAVHLHLEHELRVTDSGQVSEAAEPLKSRDVYQIILERFRAVRQRGTPEQLVKELNRLIAPPPHTPPAIQVLREVSDQQTTTQHIEIESEPGLKVQGTLVAPRSQGRKPAILVVETRPHIPEWATQLAKAGTVVLMLNPRGLPLESASSRFSGPEPITNTRAWLIGRNLPGMRAHDILQGVNLLAARPDVDAGNIRASAREVSGIWLLLAAAVDERISKVWLDRTPYSLEAALKNPVHRNLHDAVMPGFLLHWDLQDLVRKTFWSDPSDWLRNVKPLQGNYYYRTFEEPDAAVVKKFLDASL